MAVFSKELCSKKLNTWLAAEEAVATGQSYQIGTRMLTTFLVSSCSAIQAASPFRCPIPNTA